MQPSIHSNSRWILQLINCISNGLQKLLKYFSGTRIFVFFTELFVLLTAFTVYPARSALYLNDLELSILKLALLAGTSSLFNCHKFPDVSE